MFLFRAFPSYDYLIHRMITEYCSAVLPHSEISGSTLICSSPKLFAACHVLHRLLMPRHSPCALISLTFVKANCAALHPPCGEYPLRSVSFSSPVQSLRLCPGSGRKPHSALHFDSLVLELCRFNRSCLQNCIYPFKKVPQLVCCSRRSSHRALCCLAFLSFLCSVFKVQAPEKPGGGE